MGTPLPLWTDKFDWKHYLPATSLAVGKNLLCHTTRENQSVVWMCRCVMPLVFGPHSWLWRSFTSATRFEECKYLLFGFSTPSRLRNPGSTTSKYVYVPFVIMEKWAHIVSGRGKWSSTRVQIYSVDARHLNCVSWTFCFSKTDNAESNKHGYWRWLSGKR